MKSKVITLFLVALFLVGCGTPDIQKAIVGEWQDCAKDPNLQIRWPEREVEVQENIRFNEDSSFAITKDGDVIYQGRFKVFPPRENLGQMNMAAGDLELTFDGFIATKMIIGYNFDDWAGDVLLLAEGENKEFPFVGTWAGSFNACRVGSCYPSGDYMISECWNPFR